MHQVLLTFILICLCQWSSAQQNHYFKDNARWVYQTTESYEPGQMFMYSGLEENTILGDTIINGIEYKKLYKRFVHSNTTKPPIPLQGTTSTSYENSGPTFIRYDSSANKVFYKEHADSTEVMIYNFDLIVGDTIALGSKYIHRNKVLRIENSLLFGNQQRLFVLDTNYFPVRNGIIKGIGGLNGLTYNQPAFGTLSGGLLMTDLVCFEYGDSTSFSPWSLHNQFLCPSLTDFISNSKDIEIKPVNIFPNPNSGTFEIQLPDTYIGASFILYNPNSQIIQSFIIQDKITAIETIEKGVYLYLIKNAVGKTISGKIVVFH